ncbi:heparinase II/III family protein [Streptomyces sp. NPDC048172]|uniref:heparinase II/III domain-containing protein n=1 Tax=Streptomyces sp. NPDC048172 TaxID=3365505 RepID=UPI0037215B05
MHDMAEALRAGRREDLIAGYRSPELWDRVRASPLGGPALKAVAARAEAWADAPVEPLPFSLYRRYAEDGARAPFQDVYFRRRRNRLTDLALTALSEPDGEGRRCLGPLEDLIWAVCDEYAWALPAHLEGLTDPRPPRPHAEQIDLFAAETAFTLAELRHLLADRLDPLVAARIRDEVTRRVLRPLLDHPAPWWETARTNWSAVCGGSVGMAALHLLDDEDAEAELALITSRMTEAMRCFLTGYGDDGACPEGLAYWSYGFGFFTVYADALHRRTAGRVDLFAELDVPPGKLERIARFPERVFLSGTATAAFSDSPPHSTLDPGLAACLRRRFPALPPPPPDRLRTEPVNTMGSWPTALRSLVWAHESESGPEPSAHTAPEPGGYLPDVQWMIARTRTRTGGHEVAFAAKGGHNDELHNHNDVGSFVLAVDGEPLLAELGQGFYSAQYFGPGRYDILCTGSQGHSVPLLDGTPQRASRDAAAEVLAAERTARRTLFRLDLARAYPVPALTSLVREFAFSGGSLVLRDRLTAAAPVEITERFMSFAPITLEAPGRALVQGSRAALRLSYDADAWEARVREHAHVSHDGTATPVRSLDLLRTAAEADLTLRAEPVRGG